MKRHFGLPDPKTVKATDQLQKTWYPSAGLQQLPPGTPGRATPEQLGFTDPGEALTFLVIGDHGPVEDPQPFKSVVAALIAEIDNPGDVSFIDSVGDIVYFNGDPLQYGPQFYEPLARVRAPIVGILGNHDGDNSDGVAGSGIATFMANFCAAKASAPPIDPDLEYGRDTMTQPYCDWTHALEAVTIIGLWSNVPSGGHLYPQQVAWLTAEIKAAPVDRPLIVQLHHPPYSVDAHHGGSAKMGAALDGAFVAAGRWPELVLSGHVHDAQFFTRKRPGGTTTYVVIGNSGYHNTHPLAGDYAPNMDVLGDGSVICNYGDASGWGFLVLALIDGKIHGEYVQVAKEGTVTHRAYEFIA